MTYLLTITETVLNYYTVEAQSEEQARELVYEGEIDETHRESVECVITYCEEVPGTTITLNR